MLAQTTQLLSFRYVRLWRPPTDVYETDTALVEVFLTPSIVVAVLGR